MCIYIYIYIYDCHIINVRIIKQTLLNVTVWKTLKWNNSRTYILFQKFMIQAIGNENDQTTNGGKQKKVQKIV